MRALITLFIAFCSIAHAGELHFTFEDDMQGWKVVEGSFGKLRTDQKDFHHNKGPVNKEGIWHLSTLETTSKEPSDEFTGVAESPVFVLEDATIHLKVGGGKHGNTYIALCTMDGKEHQQARGVNDQVLQSITWKAPELVGKPVFIRLFDGNSGGWGHITLDAVQAQGTIDEAATTAQFKNRKPVLGQTVFVKTEAPVREPKQISATGIKHSFLMTGAWTAIIGEDNEIIWQVKEGSRDGQVLDNGNVLIAFSKDVREFTREGKVVFQHKISGGNGEHSTAWRLENGNTLISELGKKPRLLEVAPDGSIAVEVPLQPETDNQHMQTRMARKLPNGNYLVPHLLAFAVKEYQADGTIVNVTKTDLEELGGRKAENWPFTAVRLENGNTMVNLTHGNKVVDFSPDGKVVWEANNTHARGLFKDPCGGQRLPNGNTVIISHAEGRPQGVKAFELNPAKEVVWEYIDPRYHSGHEIHILTTNGKPVTPALR
jgi:hypothetical protein